MTEPAFTITIYDGTVGANPLAEAAELYREVYAEPPYLEGEDDFASFANDLPRRSKLAGFRLIVARIGASPLGFVLGHQLPVNTRWWQGALTPVADELITETPGRTFAIIELAVRMAHRRRGLGKRLHAHLTADLHEERTTLLVRPDASPAVAAYNRWGYEKVAQIEPFPGAPIYDAMIAELRSAPSSHTSP